MGFTDLMLYQQQAYQNAQSGLTSSSSSGWASYDPPTMFIWKDETPARQDNKLLLLLEEI